MSVILKASTRGKKEQYAPYLLHNTKNEQTRVFAIRGTASPDNAYDSLMEMGAYEVLSRSDKPFLQVVMNFDDSHDPTDDEWFNLIQRTENKIGYQDQPFVGVMHQYKGKWHMHATWGRYNLRTGLMMPVDHIGLNLKEVSYEHAIENEHENLLYYQQKRREKELAEQAEKQRLEDEKKRQFELNSQDVALSRLQKAEAYLLESESNVQHHKP